MKTGLFGNRLNKKVWSARCLIQLHPVHTRQYSFSGERRRRRSKISRRWRSPTSASIPCPANWSTRH
jgi:hypothetical protein